MAPAAPPIAATAAERQIQVHGDVDGSVVQGDHNVVVNDNHGTIIVKRVQPKRTRRPVAGPPRPPDPFVGRTSELARLTAAISARQPVTVSGGSGAGRTALMRAAANDPAAAPTAGLAGGVLRLHGVDDAGVALSLGDLAQRLHDAAWETVPLVKVTPESARSELGQVAALAIVDDVALPDDDLERLADLLPAGAVVIATRDAPAGGDLPDVALGPLDRADSIVLLTARAGLATGSGATSTPGAGPGDLETICSLLADWPEALVLAGRAMAARSLTPAVAAADLGAIATGLATTPAVALERAWGLARPALDPYARRLLAAAAAMPGRTHDPGLLRRMLDSPPWFDAAAATLASFDLLTLNSPRLRLPDGIRALVRNDASGLAADIGDRHLDVMTSAAHERVLDPAFVDDELGELLGAVDHAVRRGRFDDAIDLGRTIAPRLVLHGLWDAWRTVARDVYRAAGVAKRPADQAWAAHELGTRALTLGDTTEARPYLLEALDLRRSLGDTEGAAYTLHNLGWFGLAATGSGEGGNGGNGGGNGSGGGASVARWLIGGGALVVGLGLLAVLGPPAAGYVADLFGPAETATPSSAAIETPAPTATGAVTPAPALTVSTTNGEFSFDGPAWFTTVVVNVSGGVGEYRIAIDGVGESLASPAEFRIEGVVCEPLRLTGTASSGASIQAPLVIDLVPTGCPTPTPPPVSEACVTFDDLEVGTPYGRDGKQLPGDEILRTPEGVRVTVEFFHWSPRILANLLFPEERGSTTITVADASGLTPGTTFTIDVGRRAETAIVRDYVRDDSGTRIVLDAPLARAHDAGTPVYIVDPTYGEFGTATVSEDPNATFAKGPYLFLNNVNLAFDWRGLPFRPAAVQFAFRDQGGNENLAVNGSEIYRNELMEAPQQIGDVRWSWADPEGDRTAVGTLEGPIDVVLVGGQEFSLDSVCAYR